MSYKNKIATVFGGTGFIGRQIVRELAKSGYIIKVASRVPERAYFLKPCGAVGQIVPVGCDYKDDVSIANLVAGSEIVINCVGILYQKKGADFTKAHIDIPCAIAKACQNNNISCFVHFSALGVDEGSSKYAKSKRAGEVAVKTEFPDSVILRPSVVFGSGDNFFNMFARLSRALPFLPLIGGGKTRFQPVYVGDVSDAVMAVIGLTRFRNNKSSCGNIYELGGPEILDIIDVYKRVFFYTKRSRPMIKIPFKIAKILAYFLGLMPKPILTPDQVETLKTDSVVQNTAKGLMDLGVKSTGMSMIVPRYMETYCPGGRYDKKKRA